MDAHLEELPRYFHGFAKVHLQHLSTKECCEKNVTRYLRLFKVDGCSRLDLQHSVAALINLETLNQALMRFELKPATILDAKNLPMLSRGEEDL